MSSRSAPRRRPSPSCRDLQHSSRVTDAEGLPSLTAAMARPAWRSVRRGSVRRAFECNHLGIITNGGDEFIEFRFIWHSDVGLERLARSRRTGHSLARPVVETECGAKRCIGVQRLAPGGFVASGVVAPIARRRTASQTPRRWSWTALLCCHALKASASELSPIDGYRSGERGRAAIHRRKDRPRNVGYGRR